MSYKDHRCDGAPRRIIFSDHAVGRLRARLPPSHGLLRLSDQVLADRIEDMLLALHQLSPAPRVPDPQGEGYQWELNLESRLQFPMVAVLKDHGSRGEALPAGTWILVTVLPRGVSRKLSLLGRTP